MIANLQTHIAYRCPECGTVIYGFVGKFALSANLLRIKCSCGHSALDINITNDGKIRISAPCLFCKQNHNFVVSQSIFFERDLFLLNCPYANMDIAFIGDKEKIDSAIENANKELERLLVNLEAESVSDIQPTDLDEGDVLPDPVVYDRIHFLVTELTEEGRIDCPCHEGEYDVRFAPDGVQVYCKRCGATYTFNVDSEAASEAYVTSVDELTLR